MSRQCLATTLKQKQCSRDAIYNSLYCQQHHAKHQCRAITQQNRQCSRGAIPGTKYCQQHSDRLQRPLADESDSQDESEDLDENETDSQDDSESDDEIGTQDVINNLETIRCSIDNLTLSTNRLHLSQPSIQSPHQSVKSLHVDVFVQCALIEEAQSVIQIFQGIKNPDFNALKRKLPQIDIEYYSLCVSNEKNQKIDIAIGWQFKEGPDNTSNYISTIKHHLETRFWFMSGICAGIESNELAMGDVIVAEIGVGVAGKINESGEVLAEAGVAFPSGKSIIWARGMTNTKSWHSHILAYEDRCTVTPPPLPPPMFWCIRDLLHGLTEAKKVEDFLSVYSNEQLSRILKIAMKNRLITMSNVITITEEGKTLLVNDKSKHCYLPGLGSYPPPYRKEAKAIIGVIASTPYVREDLANDGVVDRIKKATAQRKLCGIEMEIYQFYHATKDLHINTLAVKGVCDFGDKWKDDLYHSIASQNAAAWILEFVRQHVSKN